MLPLSIAYLLDTVLVDKVHQALLRFPWRSEHTVYKRLPQHPHRLFELIVFGIQRADELLELALALVVRTAHDRLELAQDQSLLVNSRT